MFTPKSVAFLRALKRNNDREWFRARKEDYEQQVRGPMIEVLSRLSNDFPSFAPELISDPKVSLFRLYRDTRFSSDKTPYNTHVAARFPMRSFPRGEGAGLYMEIEPRWVWIGGGMYMPTTADLHDIRAQIAGSYPHFHRLVNAPSFRRAVGELTGERLSRVPLAYPKDHPAAHYLQFKQFLGSCEYEPSLATSSRSVPAGGRSMMRCPRLNATVPSPATDGFVKRSASLARGSTIPVRMTRRLSHPSVVTNTSVSPSTDRQTTLAVSVPATGRDSASASARM